MRLDDGVHGGRPGPCPCRSPRCRCGANISSAVQSSRRAPTPRGTPRRPRPSFDPSGTASQGRFERRPRAQVYASVVLGYAFIRRRQVLSVFLGKGRGRAEEDGRVDGVLSHRFDTTGTFCVYGGTRHKRTT